MNWRSPTLWKGLALALALAVAAYWGSWRTKQTIVAADPVVAKETKPARKWKRQKVVRVIQQPTLTADEIARLVAKYQKAGLSPIPARSGSTEAPGASLTPLAEVEDGREFEAGFTALTTLDESGHVGMTIVPRPVPFVGLPLRWRIYGEALFDAEELEMSKPYVRLGVELDTLRLGAVHLIPRLEGFRDPIRFSDEFDTGARLGIRVSFEPR